MTDFTQSRESGRWTAGGEEEEKGEERERDWKGKGGRGCLAPARVGC